MEKSFDEMTDEEFLALPPQVKRSCGDCAFLVGHVNWWCKNEQAIKARGTSIPGVCNCPYWEQELDLLKD